MDDVLRDELAADTRAEDIGEKYREIVELIGVRAFILMSEYAQGDEVYFPKLENVLAPARNRRIKREFNGFNTKELAARYNLTIKQVWNILKDAPVAGQISLFDLGLPDPGEEGPGFDGAAGG